MNQTRAKGRNLLVWFSDSELEAIRAKAGLAWMGPEEYVREAALVAAGIPAVEPAGEEVQS